MKKKSYMVWLTVLLCFCALLADGQSRRRSSGRSGSSKSSSRNLPAVYCPEETITVDWFLSKPPIYNIDGRKSRLGSNIPDIFKHWLVADISFGISYRPARNSQPLKLEKLKVELYIFAPGEARDSVSYRWFCGVQELQCVVADSEQRSRKYWASLFLPSSYVYLHMPLERGKFSTRLLEGVLIISDKDNNVLGRKAVGYRNKITAKRAKVLFESAEQLRGKKTNRQVLLWPREKTPWAWLDSDRYEFPALDLDSKPQAGGPPAPPPANAPANPENEE